MRQDLTSEEESGWMMVEKWNWGYAVRAASSQIQKMPTHALFLVSWCESGFTMAMYLSEKKDFWGTVRIGILITRRQKAAKGQEITQKTSLKYLMKGFGLRCAASCTPFVECQ